MANDWELLERYADRKDQAAFAELVARHVNFVYAAARRMLGGPGWGGREAEDVAQAVFLLLSQKASKIGRQGALAGWLFRTTRYCCCNIKIEEARRRRRERAAASQRPEASVPGANMNEDLEKLLDDALARLGEKERQAVLVRYLEGKTAAETGAVLGVSAEAVEKRLERGIGKLRAVFAGKGFVVPAAGLAGVMIAESAKAAPVGLGLSAASAVAVSGAASATVAGIAKGAAVMMKVATAKTAAVIVCLLLILGVGAGVIVRWTMRTAEPPAPVNTTGRETSKAPAGEPAAAEDVKAPPATQEAGNLVLKAGVGVGDLKFGDDAARITELFGKPEIMTSGVAWGYPSKGLWLTVSPKQGVIVIMAGSRKAYPLMNAHDFPGKLENGLGIGSSRDEIEKAYGKPDRTDSLGKDAVVLYYDNDYLWFMVQSDKIIEIYLNLSPAARDAIRAKTASLPQ